MSGVELSVVEPVTLSLLGWEEARRSTLLYVLLVMAGAGTAALFSLGLFAYYRRRSRTYLLVTVALGALVVRTIVGTGTVFGAVPMGFHHLVTHGLDLLVAVLVLCAVSANGSALERETGGDRPRN